MKRSTYNPNIAYSTAIFKLPEQLEKELPPLPYSPEGWKKGGIPLVLSPHPSHDHRTAFLFVNEGSTFSIACGCHNGVENLPTDLPAFVAFIKPTFEHNTGRKMDPWMSGDFRIIERAQGEGTEANFVTYKVGHAHFLHYDGAPVPYNFAAVGDSM